MNERVAAVGNQVKQAFTKVKDAWTGQDPSRRKRIIYVVIGLIVLVVGLALVFNLVNSRYVVLYPSMSQDETTQATAVLQSAGIPARINAGGNLEVPANQEDAAMGQLAQQGIPSSTLDYSIFEQASGLTTTDFEKHTYQTNQLQNRLQDIIKTYAGVQNAYVTLNMASNSNRVWDSTAVKSSAGVKVDLYPGAVLTPGQVSGIRYLVGSSVGIDPSEVSVIDSSGVVLAAAGDDADTGYASSEQFLLRQGFEEEIEQRMYNKTANILSLPYPNADDYRISVTAVLDYDAMITESMEYNPLEDTDHGVANHEEVQTALGVGQYAEGVVGETDNTDVPTYADLDGDGEPDMVDYYSSRDYLVSYIKTQIEKDGAKMSEASISVMIRGTLTNETRQTLRESIAAATNLPIESVYVQSVLDTGAPGTTDNSSTSTNLFFGLPPLALYIAAGVVLLLIFLLILMASIKSRSKKKRLAAEVAAEEAEKAEADRIQKEIDERKRQLKDAASGNREDDAITEEVKDFARSNPEITANLLRNWLKEGE